MIEAAQKRMLNSFAADVVKMAKSNLSSAKGATKLEGTIKYKLQEGKDQLVVSFEMADYGTFVDKGVKGRRRDKDRETRWYLGR